MNQEFLNVLFNFTLREDQVIIEHAIWLIYNFLGESKLYKDTKITIKEVVLHKMPKLIDRSKEIIMSNLINNQVKLVTIWMINNLVTNSSPEVVKEVKLFIIIHYK